MIKRKDVVFDKRVNIVQLEDMKVMKYTIVVAWFYLIVRSGAPLSGAAFNPVILLVSTKFPVLTN